MLTIQGLTVEADGKEILKGIDLTIRPGEVHALMGPNGAGKSTLSKALAGDPTVEITGGTIDFLGEDLLAMSPEERAQKGLFVSFQYPVEIAGITNLELLHAALSATAKAQGKKVPSKEEVSQLLDETMALLKIDPDFKERSVNEGFSGGERKRNEVLQLLTLAPRCALLDEIDSGLDIDAMKLIAEGMKHYLRPDRALIIITHYQRFLDYLPASHIHVVVDGKIVLSGGPEIARKLEKEGYATV